MTPFRKARLVEADGRWFADSCTVVGDVTVAEGVSIWYGVVVRGDVAKISIGARTNLQDLACVHPQHDQDVEIGADDEGSGRDVGSPGRVVRSVKEAETREIAEGVARYLDLARRHAAP
jgi:carbonic anhydrase/acetyltransferase-like protein (isoleucine patch superfamily)